MSDTARQRIDLWLFRARFVKTRGAAARLIAEGGVRLVHAGRSRRVDKASAEVAQGDAVVLPLGGALRSVRVLALPARRGPPAEARLAYSELAADLSS